MRTMSEAIIMSQALIHSESIRFPFPVKATIKICLFNIIISCTDTSTNPTLITRKYERANIIP